MNYRNREHIKISYDGPVVEPPHWAGMMRQPNAGNGGNARPVNQMKAETVPCARRDYSTFRPIYLWCLVVVDATDAERTSDMASHLGNWLNEAIVVEKYDASDLAKSDLPEDFTPPGQQTRKRPGWLHIDEDRKTVWVDGQQARLSRKEYDTLVYLHRKNRSVCCRDELIANVWPEASNRQGVSDSAIDQLIHRLRRKIEPDPARPLRLVSRKGFGFVLL